VLLIPSGLAIASSPKKMFNLLIIIVMFGILVSLGSGLYFLVRDRGKTQRTVISLSIRVALAILLLALLAWGFTNRFVIPG
jgi:predicted permease